MKEERKKLTGFNEETRTLWEASPASDENASPASGDNVKEKKTSKKVSYNFYSLKDFLIISSKREQRSHF